MASEPLIRRHLVVQGRVQGVFFRDSIRQRARAHDVAGWARNRPDGVLEALFEGSPENVERLVRFCETGPPQARVDHIDVDAQEPEGLTGFEVR